MAPREAPRGSCAPAPVSLAAIDSADSDTEEAIALLGRLSGGAPLIGPMAVPATNTRDEEYGLAEALERGIYPAGTIAAGTLPDPSKAADREGLNSQRASGEPRRAGNPSTSSRVARSILSAVRYGAKSAMGL
eukprot:525013-Prorocentrum_minimum.AAC.1